MIGSKQKYYIEEVIQPEDGETSIKIILSTSGHSACIEIYGDPLVATERAMVILNAFNNRDSK